MKAKEQSTYPNRPNHYGRRWTKVTRHKHVNVVSALIREKARLGNNLNQITKWANRYKADANAMAVIAKLINIDRGIARITRLIKVENTD